jgi:DNA (cytosine-5)-methyltransferase 1
MNMGDKMTCVEICAGAGGQALGLELAGFQHLALLEIEEQYCNTLRANRPSWNVINLDVKKFKGEAARQFKGVDLFAGGVPCPPFSVAGEQLGQEDERDLFPEAIRLIRIINPKAVLLENVRGIFDEVFKDYREQIRHALERLGFNVYWELLNASDFGVPQLRPRAVLVAIKKKYDSGFMFPNPTVNKETTVGEALYRMIKANGWSKADEWKETANTIAPTIVGGSKKHGGADLGPTRAKRSWATLGIDGNGIVDNAPDKDFSGMPRLTNRMVATIQGFPEDWFFVGKKTAVYRQIGNAFPPPVAKAVGQQIISCLSKSKILNKK